LYLFFTIYLFLISKIIYYPLVSLERKSFGSEGTILAILGIFTNNFGWGLLLFFFALFVCLVFVLITLDTKPKELKNLFSHLIVDFHGKKNKEIIKYVIYDLVIIEFYSVLIFLVIELFLSALASITLGIVVPMLLQKGVKMFTYLYMILSIEHIVMFPIFIYGYYYFVKKRISSEVKINLELFLDEEGEIDYNKWKTLTWGRKPYSYNWKNEEYYPIICPSCGSVISSNLTICPICDADLVEEISKLKEVNVGEIEEKEREKKQDKIEEKNKKEDAESKK